MDLTDWLFVVFAIAGLAAGVMAYRAQSRAAARRRDKAQPR